MLSEESIAPLRQANRLPTLSAVGAALARHIPRVRSVAELDQPPDPFATETPFLTNDWPHDSF
jgi:hypothetical protein